MSKVAVVRDRGAQYPKGPGPYPPEERYPEFHGDRGSPQSSGGEPPAAAGANRAFRLVRRVLAEHGCDAARFGTPAWNPLSEWIRPGARVFVLPNLVMHRRWWEPPAQFDAQCTHGSVLRAVLEYVLLATGEKGGIRFGNAPIQGSNFDRSAEEAGYSDVGRHYRDRGLPVEGPLDLRMEGRVRADDPTVRIELGADSLLETLRGARGGEPIFRVGTCNPGFTARFHGPRSHVYLVHRDLLEADVIVSVPKLKMHSKVGLTCALKGAVGTVTKKGCLAHFREGAPEGGDEFPCPTRGTRLASKLNDISAHAGSGRPGNWVRLATRVGVRVTRSLPTAVISGNWPGNDTCWRMAIDLSRILLYGRADGTMSDTPQRRHLVLVDGIVAGEGDGPLHATPRPAGIALFGTDPTAVDAGCAYVMGLDPRAIPLLAQSFAPHRYPLTSETLEGLEFLLDGRSASPGDLAAMLDPAPRPPRQWQGACEYRRSAETEQVRSA